MSADRPVAPLTLLGAVAPACEGPDCLVPEPSGLESSTGVVAAD